MQAETTPVAEQSNEVVNEDQPNVVNAAQTPNADAQDTNEEVQVSDTNAEEPKVDNEEASNDRVASINEVETPSNTHPNTDDAAQESSAEVHGEVSEAKEEEKVDDAERDADVAAKEEETPVAEG